MFIALDLHNSSDQRALRHQPTWSQEPPALTHTQIKILDCVHSGLLNKQIAYEPGMAEATVKVHMTALMHKLGHRLPS